MSFLITASPLAISDLRFATHVRAAWLIFFRLAMALRVFEKSSAAGNMSGRTYVAETAETTMGGRSWSRDSM
jgi:hypothetical protein